MDETIDIEDCLAWIEENTRAKGLIAVVPMTSQALAKAKNIPHFYAVQIVEKFNGL